MSATVGLPFLKPSVQNHMITVENGLETLRNGAFARVVAKSAKSQLKE
jgi:hypothetical protein